MHSLWLFLTDKHSKQSKLFVNTLYVWSLLKKRWSFLRCHLITPNNLQCCWDFELAHLGFLHDLDNVPNSKCYFWLRGGHTSPKNAKTSKSIFFEMSPYYSRGAIWSTVHPKFKLNVLYLEKLVLCAWNFENQESG